VGSHHLVHKRIAGVGEASPWEAWVRSWIGEVAASRQAKSVAADKEDIVDAVGSAGAGYHTVLRHY
jgi:hypothetical protein